MAQYDGQVEQQHSNAGDRHRPLLGSRRAAPRKQDDRDEGQQMRGVKEKDCRIGVIPRGDTVLIAPEGKPRRRDEALMRLALGEFNRDMQMLEQPLRRVCRMVGGAVRASACRG